ncbi:MAG: hypothetical protein KC464_35550, partial [Myxococcales bacterium]|nr:hypothetical protein [Myxococcales bacterium]
MPLEASAAPFDGVVGVFAAQRRRQETEISRGREGVRVCAGGVEMFDRDDERVERTSIFEGAAGATGADRAPPTDDWRRLDRALRGIAKRRAALDAEEAR